MKITHWITALLFPEKCVLCGKILGRGEQDLCRTCRVDMPECPISRIKHPFLDSWLAVWYYEGKVRRSILRYKFHGKRHYAAAYARLLAMRLLREERADADVITWIPVSEKRLRKRGFDQVELIARKLSEELEIPAQPLLWKRRDNPPQSRITGRAERRANVLGAYEAIHLEQLENKRVLLLDDVLTTGSTAEECGRVLLTAGAREVHFAAVAAAGKQNSDR